MEQLFWSGCGRTWRNIRTKQKVLFLSTCCTDLRNGYKLHWETACYVQMFYPVKITQSRSQLPAEEFRLISIFRKAQISLELDQSLWCLRKAVSDLQSILHVVLLYYQFHCEDTQWGFSWYQRAVLLTQSGTCLLTFCISLIQRLTPDCSWLRNSGSSAFSPKSVTFGFSPRS